MRFRLSILIIAIFLLCVNTISAQRFDARKQVIDLKKGVLLVRLSTREKPVEDLKNRGKISAAEQIRSEQEQKNKLIVQAFNKYFKFCDYRFFYSQYSSEILNKNFKFYVFDKDLKPDVNFSLENRNFYIAEFGILQADTNKISRDSKIFYDKDFSAEEKAVYTTNTPNKIFALKILDNKNYQLRYPFPYYVAGFNTNRAVKRMNSKLSSFYNSSNRKK